MRVIATVQAPPPKPSSATLPAPASPRDPARRGSHVCLRHPEAWRLGQALIHVGIVGDYRTPDRLRLGPVPLTTRYTDVWDAMDATRRILTRREYEDFPAEPAQVT